MLFIRMFILISQFYSSDSICWNFLIDVFLCVASVIGLMVFNKIASMNRSNNMENSVIIDSMFGRNKYLKSKSRTILEGIGNVNTIELIIKKELSHWCFNVWCRKWNYVSEKIHSNDLFSKHSLICFQQYSAC